MIRPFADKTPIIAPSAWVDRSGVVIGDVVLGEDTSVWPCAVIRGDVNYIRVGERTNIQDGSVLHVTHAGPYSPKGGPLIIGDDVTVGHNVTLHACTVGNGCLIGMGAVVLDGAILGDHCFVAAGSIVSPGKVVPPRSLWRGQPARHARELGDEDVEMLMYSAKHYAILKDQYAAADRDL
ncbi:MAG: gamma carbonic anhydrase family protein [Lysobacteraceae bacterium]|nr:MAG: gamma carbonic anhydrase family protein [Xanthomonadaceae bacterium]